MMCRCGCFLCFCLTADVRWLLWLLLTCAHGCGSMACQWHTGLHPNTTERVLGAGQCARQMRLLGAKSMGL
jgi:hypothetical protein